MPDLNPIHYLLIGVTLLLAIVSGLYWYQGTQYELTKARYDSFVAETKATGLIQEREGKEINAKHEQSKKDADNENASARAGLVVFADQLRIASKNTSGSLLPATASSSGSPQGTCFDSTELTAAMGRYSEAMGRIRQQSTELIIEGAKAVVDLDGSKRWAQSVQ